MTTKCMDDFVTLDSGRTLASKLADIISASDYGASAGGTSSANTTAINSAITAASAASSGFVIINEGISYTEGSLVIPDDVTLIVFGAYGTVTFLVKDQGASPIGRGGVGIKSQGHTGVILRAVDQGVSAAPLVQIVDSSAGDLAAIHTAFVEMDEVSAPATPAGNKSRLYTRDNGAGKTQLVVQFPTGAVQVVATEP